MQQQKNVSRLHIGQRNVKTALAAALCALLYYFFGEDPTFACIGAIFGMGSDMSNSRLSGGNRFFGTIIGGVLGMLLFRLYICFYPDGSRRHLLMTLVVFVGIVVLIVASQLLRCPGAIPPGGVVLCIILFNTPVDSYVSYPINRMIDTGIGVAVALLINWAFSQERVTRWLDRVRHRPASGSDDGQ